MHIEAPFLRARISSGRKVGCTVSCDSGSSTYARSACSASICRETARSHPHVMKHKKKLRRTKRTHTLRSRDIVMDFELQKQCSSTHGIATHGHTSKACTQTNKHKMFFSRGLEIEEEGTNSIEAASPKSAAILPCCAGGATQMKDTIRSNLKINVQTDRLYRTQIQPSGQPSGISSF
jgi:hypothetical protein